MFKSWIVGVIAAVALAFADAAPRTITPEFEARVIHVNDGDTVVARTVEGRELSVRLASIDAPEASHGRCKPGQPWAEKSAQRLSSLVKGKTIKFRCFELDRYDRSVCDLALGDTTANRLLVEEGLAWANRSANRRYLRDREVAEAEHRAKAAAAGLWKDTNSVPPWEWRHQVWKSSCKVF